MKNIKKLLMALSLVLVTTFSLLIPTTPRFEAVKTLESEPQVENNSLNQEGLNDYVYNSPLVQGQTNTNLPNEYDLIWEPNNVQGSVHSVVVSSDKNLLAVGGGYLCDNEVHIYRWNEGSRDYFHVWDSGDEVIRNDVLSVAFADIDANGLIEVIAGSADGRIYVFEQRGAEGILHFDDSDNQFELVWNSEEVWSHQVWDVTVDDLDADGKKEIIAGCWDNRVYVFEYAAHSGFPYCTEHWMRFTRVWDSGDTIKGRIYDVATGDTDNDNYREIIAASYDCKVYIFENSFLSCSISQHADNTYVKIWDSGDVIFQPVTSVAVSNRLDTDPYGEIVASSYGQGVFVFQYESATGTYSVRKLLRPVENWELGVLLTTGKWTGYELDSCVDNKTYGWAAQGIIEPANVPYPWNRTELGGNSALSGPLDSISTTFDAEEAYKIFGIWGTIGGDDGQFRSPYAIAIDALGNVYVSDPMNYRIQKFSSKGHFLTKWGEEGSGEGQFGRTAGITTDSNGNVYVADFNNSCVQKFTSEGKFLLAWGTYGLGAGQFSGPDGVATDSNGYVYVADSMNHRVQKFNATTGAFVSMWGEYGTATGQFNTPSGLAVDAEGNIYVVDTNNQRVQKFDSNGGFLLSVGNYGHYEGEFFEPKAVTVDPEGNVFVTDDVLDRVQKFTSQGAFVTSWNLKPGQLPGYFDMPQGLAVGPSGCIYVVDSGNHRIQMFALETYSLVTVWSGGSSSEDRFRNPWDMAIDIEGNVYVTDTWNHRVQKFGSDGRFILEWGQSGNGTGQFGYPAGIAVDMAGSVYIADLSNNRIQKFTSNGTFLTSWGEKGSLFGQFNAPMDLALDADQNVYIADVLNNRVQKFSSQGEFLTSWGGLGTDDGNFTQPISVAVDSEGYVYVVDAGNKRVQKFTEDGSFISKWSADFKAPYSLTIDSLGCIYVADFSDNSIMKFTNNGEQITTLRGLVASYNESVNILAPIGVAADTKGFLYVAQFGGSIVMKLRPQIVHSFVAEAVVDFGEFEELGGQGTPDGDLSAFFPHDLDLRNVEFAISKDKKTFVPVPFSSLSKRARSGGYYELVIDIDPTLRQSGWESYRYVRIGVKHGVLYNIDSLSGVLARPITTALAVTTGYLNTTETELAVEKIIIGTVDGSILAYTASGTMIWQSQADTPRFSLDVSIRSIVELGTRGRMPTWRFLQTLVNNDYFTALGFNVERLEGYCLANIDGTSALDMVVTILESGVTRLLYLRNVGTDAAPSYSYQANYFATQTSRSSDAIYSYATPTLADLDSDGDLDLILSMYEVPVDGESSHHMEYYENNGANFWTHVPNVLGNPNNILAQHNLVAKPVFRDMDSDGDLDLTLGDNRLYYFERLGTGSSFQWNLVENFYKGINDEMREEELVGQVAFSDFDYDGDLDATVAHASETYSLDGLKPETSRLTYFENTGSLTTPTWEKRRSLYEPDFRGSPITKDHGYVDPQMKDVNGDNMADLILLQDSRIDCYTASITHNNYLVGTYPLVYWIEVDKRPLSYGYDAYASWNNGKNLDHWTYSISIADADKDGKDEVIVGSFDNNIYTFEHLYNNTYRRAWRSPDLKHSTSFLVFTSTVWDDVMDLVVGDQDGDGKREVIAAAGSRIYIFENIGNDKYELAWDSQDIIGIQQNIFFGEPYSLATDLMGNVYVADSFADRIWKFGSSGMYVTRWGSYGTDDGQFASPRSIAVDSDGDVYVADTDNNRIQKFSSDGEFILKWGKFGTGEGEFMAPMGITIDIEGNVYVVDTGNSRIQKFTETGAFLVVWGEKGDAADQFSQPTGIAADAEGNLYVVDRGSNRIQKFSNDGEFILQWEQSLQTKRLNQPSDVAVDAQGYVYVADTGNHYIQKFTSDGTYVGAWGGSGTDTGKLSSPEGVVVGIDGNVFVADTGNHRIQKFTTSGTFLKSWGKSGYLFLMGYPLVNIVSTNNDLDGDNRAEIIASSENWVYVFENTGNNDYKLVWVNDLPADAWKSVVRTITTGDADRDGFREMVIGGGLELKNAIGETQDVDGWVRIFENANDTSKHVDNTFEEVWTSGDDFNDIAVNSVVLGDHDYDGWPEIFVGHDSGINIYECTGNNDYRLVRVLTSKAGYPLLTTVPVSEAAENVHSPEIIQLTNGNIFAVYEGDVGAGKTRLFLRRSLDNGTTWSDALRITADKDTKYQLGSGITYETEPSMIQRSAGSIWLAFRSYRGKFSNQIWVIYSATGQIWSDPYPVDQAPAGDLVWQDHSPNVMEFPNRTVTVTFLRHFRNRLNAAEYGWGILSASYVGEWTPAVVIDCPVYKDQYAAGRFNATSFELTKMGGDYYAIAFAGRNVTSTKPDNDIWITLSSDFAKWNASLQLCNGIESEDSPSICELQSGTLMVVYKEGLFNAKAVYSVGWGSARSWSAPETILETPTFFNFRYTLNPKMSLIRIRNGGFILGLAEVALKWQLSGSSLILVPFDHVLIGVNPWEGWWENTLNKVSCLAVDDTDKDTWNEIIAGADKHLFVFEMNSTYDLSLHAYDEVWKSPELVERVTDVAVGDINANDLMEIVATAARGNLYSFEWISNATSGGGTEALTQSESRAETLKDAATEGDGYDSSQIDTYRQITGSGEVDQLLILMGCCVWGFYVIPLDYLKAGIARVKRKYREHGLRKEVIGR